MKKNYPTLLIACLVSVAACQTKVKNNTKYQTVGLVKDDPTFLALKDTAQKHINYFIDSIKKHGSDTNNYHFIVKSDFVDKDTHEHMWSQLYGYSNGSFIGVFIDSAFNVKNIKTGDKVIILKNDVEDWALYDLKRKTIVGRFSERYLKSKEVRGPYPQHYISKTKNQS